MKSLLALVLPEGDLEQISKELMFFRHYCSENIGMCNKEVSSWFFFFSMLIKQSEELSKNVMLTSLTLGQMFSTHKLMDLQTPV